MASSEGITETYLGQSKYRTPFPPLLKRCEFRGSTQLSIVTVSFPGSKLNYSWPENNTCNNQKPKENYRARGWHKAKILAKKNTFTLKSITWRCFDKAAPGLPRSRSIENRVSIQQNELDTPWRTRCIMSRNGAGTAAQKTTLEQGSPPACKPRFLKLPPFPVPEVTKQFASHPLN